MPLKVGEVVKGVVARINQIPEQEVTGETALGPQFRVVGKEIELRFGTTVSPFHENETVKSFTERVESYLYA